ncbi:MAG: tetratricopeptide repeat protein [Candidatus Omnitrophota bacterium]
MVKQGVYYWERGNYDLAEKSFKEALSNNPENSNAYLKLGGLYQEQGAYLQAEESFKKATHLHPDDANAFFGLAIASREQGESKSSQVEEALKKAIGLDPYHAEYYLMLGHHYAGKAEVAAEESFKKSIELMPGNYAAYRELGRAYLRQSKFQQAEALFKEFQNKYPDNDRIYQDLIQLLEKKGLNEKVTELGEECFWNVTAKNFIKMEEILSKKKIKLVCVQYPMRDSASLKEIFEGKEGIIFVDNEKTFKERVNKDNYGEYFIDEMFGDFGHCTEKGNRLLAENIARIILKEVFGK